MSETFGKYTVLRNEQKIKCDILHYTTVVVKSKVVDVVRYVEEDDTTKKGYSIQVSDADGKLIGQLNVDSVEFVAIHTAISMYFKDVIKSDLAQVQKKVSNGTPFKFNTSERVIKAKKK